MREAVRILLIGAGVRGRVWAGVCTETDGIDLVGVLDQDSARAESLRKNIHQANIPVYETMSSALRDAAPDAVIVATPPESHHSLVDAALTSGKHVLCEKPLSEDIGEVIDLIRKADERRLFLLVGMNFRYLSTSQRIREYVQEGRLGKLSHAQFSYLRHRDGNRADLNDYPLTMPFPMLFEQSIHHFDLLRYCYCSEVEALVADSWKPPWSTYAEDCCVSILFRFANNVRVNYLGTWTAGWNKMTFSWRSEFSSGVLIQQSQFDDLVRVDFQPVLGLSGLRFKTAADFEPPRKEVLKPCTPFVDDSRLLLAELVRAIDGEVFPATTASDHLHSLCLVLAAIESIQTGKWVELTDFYGKLGLPSDQGEDPRGEADDS